MLDETKRWLNRGICLVKEIKELKEARNNAALRATHITPSYDGESVCGTKDPHKYDTYVESFDELTGKLMQRIAELNRIQGEIIDVISQVPEGKLRTVLLGKYINNKTFEQIAYEMGIDWRHCMRLRNIGIQRVDKILSKKQIIFKMS